MDLAREALGHRESIGLWPTFRFGFERPRVEMQSQNSRLLDLSASTKCESLEPSAVPLAAPVPNATTHPVTIQSIWGLAFQSSRTDCDNMSSSVAAANNRRNASGRSRSCQMPCVARGLGRMPAACSFRDCAIFIVPPLLLEHRCRSNVAGTGFAAISSSLRAIFPKGCGAVRLRVGRPS